MSLAAQPCLAAAHIAASLALPSWLPPLRAAARRPLRVQPVGETGGLGHPARGHASSLAPLSAVGGVAFKRRARWKCFQRLTSREALSAGLQSVRV